MSSPASYPKKAAKAGSFEPHFKIICGKVKYVSEPKTIQLDGSAESHLCWVLHEDGALLCHGAKQSCHQRNVVPAAPSTTDCVDGGWGDGTGEGGSGGSSGSSRGGRGARVELWGAGGSAAEEDTGGRG